MIYKPENPAASFISPQNIFSVVQGLQSNTRRNSLVSGSLGSGKTAAPSTGDPDKFQRFLGILGSRAQRF